MIVTFAKGGLLPLLTLRLGGGCVADRSICASQSDPDSEHRPGAARVTSRPARTQRYVALAPNSKTGGVLDARRTANRACGGHGGELLELARSKVHFGTAGFGSGGNRQPGYWSPTTRRQKQRTGSISRRQDRNAVVVQMHSRTGVLNRRHPAAVATWGDSKLEPGSGGYRFRAG